jgi:hypothetical protein
MIGFYGAKCHKDIIKEGTGLNGKNFILGMHKEYQCKRIIILRIH